MRQPFAINYMNKGTGFGAFGACIYLCGIHLTLYIDLFLSKRRMSIAAIQRRYSVLGYIFLLCDVSYVYNNNYRSVFL